ncbi:unnamed protein product [Paramecium primaurelia]|uniref:Uncharacterized protein n=1 Tax=Paramecium primaurelia TaxID=5886 RepID=A0A8S1NJA6_PARPR|nr:unnamed protein product [Paramecium primaurelia]
MDLLFKFYNKKCQPYSLRKCLHYGEVVADLFRMNPRTYANLQSDIQDIDNFIIKFSSFVEIICAKADVAINSIESQEIMLAIQWFIFQEEQTQQESLKYHEIIQPDCIGNPKIIEKLLDLYQNRLVQIFVYLIDYSISIQSYIQQNNQQKQRRFDLNLNGSLSFLNKNFFRDSSKQQSRKGRYCKRIYKWYIWIVNTIQTQFLNYLNPYLRQLVKFTTSIQLKKIENNMKCIFKQKCYNGNLSVFLEMKNNQSQKKYFYKFREYMKIL